MVLGRDNALQWIFLMEDVLKDSILNDIKWSSSAEFNGHNNKDLTLITTI